MMSVAYRQASVLGLVQGLGEFLPVSSSAHLIVVPWLFDWEVDPQFDTLTYDVALHLGTTLALLSFSWRDWLRLAPTAGQPCSASGRLVWMIVIASAPGAIAGYLVDDLAASAFRSPMLIAGTLAAMGTILYAADRFCPQTRTVEGIAAHDACALGLAQALALVPGVSRLGSTMTMARALGFRRDAAARLSFLMAMPITVGAMLFKLKDIKPADVDGPFVAGIVVSGVSGALAIRLLQDLLSRGSHSMLPFALYRCALASLILLRVVSGRWSVISGT